MNISHWTPTTAARDVGHIILGSVLVWFVFVILYCCNFETTENILSAKIYWDANFTILFLFLCVDHVIQFADHSLRILTNAWTVDKICWPNLMLWALINKKFIFRLCHVCRYGKTLINCSFNSCGQSGEKKLANSLVNQPINQTENAYCASPWTLNGIKGVQSRGSLRFVSKANLFESHYPRQKFGLYCEETSITSNFRKLEQLARGHIEDSSSIDIFKRKLKTFHFKHTFIIIIIIIIIIIVFGRPCTNSS